MSKKQAHRMWYSLVNELPKGDASLTAVSLMKSIQRWLRGNLSYFPMDSQQAWSLTFWAEINIDDYPAQYTERTEFEPEVELRNLKNGPNSSVDNMGMLLKELFEHSMLFIAPIDCLQCHGPLRIFKSKDGEVVYECEQCGWAQDASGKQWNRPEENQIGKRYLFPPTTDDLLRLGILK